MPNPHCPPVFFESSSACIISNLPLYSIFYLPPPLLFNPPCTLHPDPYGGFSSRLKLCSYSVNGLNITSKRGKILYQMHKQVNVLLLQETHFYSDSTPSCSNRCFNWWIHSTHLTQKTKGVSIAFQKMLPIDMIDQISDPQGRYLFVKFSLWGTKYTEANIYLPNVNQVSSALQYIQILAGFMEGKLILGGDFNAPLDPLLDSSMSRSSLSFPKLRGSKAGFLQLTSH